MQSGFLLDVVICQGAAILQLLASEDQTLLVRGNPLLVLDLGLHVVNGVIRLHLQPKTKKDVHTDGDDEYGFTP